MRKGFFSVSHACDMMITSFFTDLNICYRFSFITTHDSTSFVPQRLEYPTSVRKVTGSISAVDSDFFSLCHASDMMIASFLRFH